MIVRQQLFHRTYHDALVEQHGDAIANRIKAVQIVRDHENSEAQALAAIRRSARRSAPRRSGRGRRSARRGTADPGRAPGRGRGSRACACRRDSSEGFLSPASAGRPTIATLSAAIVAHQLFVEPGMLADRHDDVVGDAERGEQRAVLELHAGARLHARARPCRARRPVSTPSISMLPLACRIEADDGAQQHGLAGSRSADQADHLAAKYVEVEIVVDDVVAELGAHAAQLQHDIAAVAMIGELPAFEQLGRAGLCSGSLSRAWLSAITRSPAGR